MVWPLNPGVEAESVSQRLLTYQDGERRLTNWLHLAEILQRVEQERGASRIGLVDWLERSIAASDPRAGDARSELGAEATLLRLERDDQAVSLVTLHRSKGLEYEIVYLPSLWEEPSARAISIDSAKDATKARQPIRFYDEDTQKRTLELGGPDYATHVERGREEALSEQFRLLYVGLTRAKQQCVVHWGAMGSAFAKTPLAWLLHSRECEAAGKDRNQSTKILRAWSDEEWFSAWRELANQAADTHAEAISVETVCFEKRERWLAPRVEDGALRFNPRKRVLPRLFCDDEFLCLGSRCASDERFTRIT